MLKESQQVTLEVLDLVQQSVLTMAVSTAPIQARIAQAWSSIDAAFSRQSKPHVPTRVYERIAGVERILTRYGPLEKTVNELTVRELTEVANAIIELYADLVSTARE